MQHINLNDVEDFTAKLVLSARSSIEITADASFAFSRSCSKFHIENLLDLADKRLFLRIILGLPNEDELLAPNNYNILQKQKDIFSSYATTWDIRILNNFDSAHSILIDRNAIIFSVYPAYDSTEYFFCDEPKVLEEIQKTFDNRWKSACSVNLLYEDHGEKNNEFNKFNLLTVSNNQWGQILQQLIRNPELMRVMTPRKFEELVAELLTREGLCVTLTPQARDGGRDILASLKTSVGEHLYLVECKRYSQDRPVGVQLVRQLYGIVEVERATAGLLVTTSSFTAGATNLQKTLAHRIALRDYSGIVSWIQKLSL